MATQRPLMQLTVPADAAGMRLVDFLRRRLGFSRGMLKRLRLQDGVRVDGQPRRGDLRLGGGEEICLTVTEAASPGIVPEPMDLDILWEDEDLLVLNKPPGIMVHPAHGYLTGTLANGVAAYFAAQGLAAPVRPLHRLDRETSGAVVMAKNAWAHQRLSVGLTRRTVARRYLAVASGRLAVASGVIDGAIARETGHPLRRSVVADGAPARTRYRVLATAVDTSATVLELQLETGRTHQIRVHLAHLGHPLLGDRLYAGPPDRIARQALHARAVAFTHPRSGAVLTVPAPLPPDLRRLLADLGLDPGGF